MKRNLILLLSFVLCLCVSAQQKKKPATGKEPLFGKALATYTISSRELAGATFYLVSGHGGPDPGAIGTYQGHKLHEDGSKSRICVKCGEAL